jgi:hypothetical protein
MVRVRVRVRGIRVRFRVRVNVSTLLSKRCLLFTIGAPRGGLGLWLGLELESGVLGFGLGLGFDVYTLLSELKEVS